MGTKNQLYNSMQDFWNKHRKKIVDSLSGEDGWEDRIHWYKEGNPDTEESDDEIIEGLVWERYADFMSEFLSHAEDHDGKLMVYRCLSVEDEDEFLFHVANGTPLEDYEGLGVFWSWREDKAECHWGASGHSGNVTVHALIPFNSIDIETTLELNCHPSLGEDEAEIRLKEGSPIEVIGVQTSDSGYVSPLDHGEKPIPMTAGYPMLKKILKG